MVGVAAGVTQATITPTAFRGRRHHHPTRSPRSRREPGRSQRRRGESRGQQRPGHLTVYIGRGTTGHGGWKARRPRRCVAMSLWSDETTLWVGDRARRNHAYTLRRRPRRWQGYRPGRKQQRPLGHVVRPPLSGSPCGGRSMPTQARSSASAPPGPRAADVVQLMMSSSTLTPLPAAPATQARTSPWPQATPSPRARRRHHLGRYGRRKDAFGARIPEFDIGLHSTLDVQAASGDDRRLDRERLEPGVHQVGGFGRAPTPWPATSVKVTLTGP